MNRLSVSLAAIIVVGSCCSVLAQDPKPAASPVASPGLEKDQPKSEIDEALAELRKRGESIITLCECKDPKHQTKEGVVNGRAIELVTPPYPAIARSSHASGQVAVLVIIDKDGNVMAAQVVDGHPLLRGAAIKAAKASRFTPPLVEGKPVNVLGEIIYNFVTAP